MDHSVLFEEQVSLVPSDFSKEITSINDILLDKLKDKLENKCSRNGYVLPNSLKILSRSLGKASLGRYVGDYVFYVQLQGNVLNPPDGIVLEGEVISKNKMGLYINYKNAIRVIVPRDLHIGNEDFDSVTVGDKIKVEIKKSRFQVNDESILSVGLFISKSGVADSNENEDEDLVLENE
jgi:DNA-directed RNA polymerase subunit E'/Rpb7